MVKGLLVDWGGVLTTNLRESIAAWLAADGIDDAHYYEVMSGLFKAAYNGQAENTIHALERGELGGPAFERDLAARLRRVDGGPMIAEGLLNRMFAGFERIDAMYDMLRDVREAGLRTCLLSNSWANDYPRQDWDQVFDGIVISGEVGMRKPEPRIFAHALGVIDLPGSDCVFIDDIEANLTAASEFGITGILHRDPDTTITELESLLRLPLRRA